MRRVIIRRTYVLHTIIIRMESVLIPRLGVGGGGEDAEEGRDLIQL